MERRRYERVAGNGRLDCCLGEVVDISVGGLQVLRKGRQALEMGDFLDGKLQHESGEIDVRTRVVWVKKLGIFRYAIGLEFIEMNEDELDEIVKIVECGRAECVGPRLWSAA